MAPIDACQANYLKYCKLFKENADGILDPKLFLKACSFLKKVELLGKYEQYDTHQVMEPILGFLQQQGFHGVLTREVDFNDETMPSTRVTTGYAIGIFDKAGLDMVGLVPMRYKWLKKINPDYLHNSTGETASQKTKRFI